MVQIAEARASSIMADAKKLVELERVKAAGVESGAAQKVTLTSQMPALLFSMIKDPR